MIAESDIPRSAFAASLAHLGFPVFPCVPGGKTPATADGFKSASCSIDLVLERWGEIPDANIGISTVGLVVVDVDDVSSEWYLAHRERLSADCGMEALTPRGGRHYYFRQAPDQPVRCSAGKVAPGIDIRADGGYVIAPPSTVNGVKYAWVLDRINRAENLPVVPDWLREMLIKTRPREHADRGGSAAGGNMKLISSEGPIPEGSRNDQLTRIGGKLRRRGAKVGDLIVELKGINASRCVPPLDDNEVEAIARSVGRYPAGHVKGSPSLRLAGEASAGSSAADPVEIVIAPDEHRVVDEAVEALASDEDIFARGGVLVRVVTPIDDPQAAPAIVRLPTATLRERLTRLAQFVREGKDGLKPAHPTGWLVSAVEARADWPQIRPIAGVADAPVLRPDGSVVQTDGYDPETKVVLALRGSFPQVPEFPTLDDAKAAVGVLHDVVSDFRFERPEHRSAFLASVLTIIGRFAFTGPSPLFLVDANIRGAGKGLLCQVASVIGVGRTTPVSGAPSDAEETRKTITAAAICGDRIILFDNVEGKFGDASLDRALTCDRWRDRVLGKSEQVDLPLNPVWLATGNNIVIGADTARRVVHIRLDVLEEKPEERRDFKHPNLLAYVQSERARLYVAGLTILAAYMKAGMPEQAIDPFGSFEGWSRLVRSAVVFAGEVDPCLGRKYLTESADSAFEAISTLISSWREYDPTNEGVIAAHLIAELYASDGLGQSGEPGRRLRAALDGLPGMNPSGKAPTARLLGNCLRRFRRRVVGGVFLDTDKAREASAGKLWRLFDSATDRPLSDGTLGGGTDSDQNADPDGEADGGAAGHT